MKTNPQFSTSSIRRVQAVQMRRAQSRPAPRERAASQRPDRPRRIVVPLDGSPAAEHALAWALGIAERWDAAVQLVHVAPAVDAASDALLYWDSLRRLPREEKCHYLSGLVRSLEDVTAAPVAARLIAQPPSAPSLQALFDLEPDLVVMASRRRGPLARLMRHSAADWLRRHSKVPVIWVPADQTPAPLRPRFVERILLPIDHRPQSQAALDALRRLDLFRQARHTLLNLEPLSSWYAADRAALHAYGLGVRPTFADSLTRVGALAHALRTDNRRAVGKVIAGDETRLAAVLRCARQTNADLIALSDPPRGRVARLLRPALADRLLRRTPVPLMLVPPEDSSYEL